MKRFFLRLAVWSAITAAVGFAATLTNTRTVPPIPGALGQAQSVDANSITIQTKTGAVTVEISRPLATYHEVPSDLNHVTASSYVGVASEDGPNGVPVAKKIWIFPAELSGAVEGSVITDPAPGAASHSRMTNGSVSRSAEPHSRMTNGTAQKKNGTTLLVNYQDGSKTITVPPGVPIVEVAAGDVTPKAGDVVYAATFELPNGKLATNKIGIFSIGPTPKKGN
jgi:hypothetical protein